MIGATRFKTPLSICRSFAYLSPYTGQKVKEKLAGVQKRPYLCGVKMIHRHPFDVKTTIILTIKKYTTMYAIAFFTTVILFSASLYVGHKIAESVRNHKISTAESDFVITPNPYIGAFRHSA